MGSRYIINKLGLINFWYYDIEEFQLSEGNLLLRGSNGSGKSVTMQSFIPLLLDGNKSPERLDPFGTKARTIANYLLDEDDTEKTAYLYMEFKKSDSENYITIGMGLKAIKNKPIQSWYFIVSDGRRVGKDIFLYRDAGELIPLTKKQLQNELGEGNFYTESQKGYMEMVNRYLFGFDDIESYEELLNLLISIRSPKLSKDFKPTEIYKILTDSLKVLSDEDLRPISDSMENMDSLKDSLDENKRAYNAAKNIKYHYDRYNSEILSEKGKALINSNNQLREAIKSKEDKNKSYEKNKKEVDEFTFKLQEKDKELKIANEKHEKLINREEYKNKTILEEIKIRLEDNKKSKSRKEKDLEEKKTKEKEISLQVKELENNKDMILKDLNNNINELENLAEEINIQECMGLKDNKVENLKEEDLNYREGSIKKYEEKLKVAEKYFKEYEDQKARALEVTKELDILNKSYEDEKKNMERAEELFLTEKENYKVNINKAVNNNKIYMLDEDEKSKIFKTIDKINEFSDIQECKNILQDFLNNRINDRKSYITIENRLIEDYFKEIKNIKDQIEDLKNNKEIEPERSEGVKKNRERLKSKGINCIPLYKALDYNKDISDKVRGNIEAALIDMGLLDALIIDPKDKDEVMNFDEGMEDKYIFSDPNLMSFNLSTLLSIDKELKGNSIYFEVDNVLQSIFLGESGSTYLDENGFYKIGILGGKTTDNYTQKFIGEASRKRHREELIKEKENLIKEIEELISKHEASINILNNEIDILNNEYNRLPHSDSILEGLKIIKELESILKRLDNDIIIRKNKEFEEKQKLNDIKIKLMDKIKGFDEITSLEIVIEFLDIVNDYKDELTKAKIALNKMFSAINLLKAKSDALESTLKDIDDLYYDINLITRKINEDDIKKNGIEEALSKIDIVEIESEIDNCIRIKKDNPEEIKELSTAIGKRNSTIEALEDEIEKLLVKIEEIEEEFKLNEKIFLEEYDLQYVFPKEEGKIIDICEKIVSELTNDNEKNREYYSNSLTEALNKNAAELREYNIKEIALFNDGDLSWDKKWLRERRDFKAKIQGKEVNIIVLMDLIKKSIEELDLLISEEERKVFEEVLMNTISQKVRAKIYQSINWVKKINDLMNSMDTSSSLKLSLVWTPKKSEAEGQLDISKLIDILSRGERNTDTDLKNLAKHFSEKVKEELRKYEGTGEVRNYHSIIKDVLDYRKWYEFKLYFVKNNERRKELTNNAFFQFSGGEKAMSMYIPLFSAIYARYDKGRVDCPRIISMDEAFAGVDENNIRDMFRLLKDLDLNYILNSQILWGDYDTVNSLAISELIREENDDVVTVLNYLWNGKEKVLLDE